MFKWVISNAGSLVKGLLPSLIPILILGMSILITYFFYTTNKTLQHTIVRQEQIIGDLRRVNEEVGGLYSRITERTTEVIIEASESINRIETIAKEHEEESIAKILKEVGGGRVVKPINPYEVELPIKLLEELNK